MQIAHERLLQLVSYDSISGIFTRKTRAAARLPGSKVGTVGHDGYLKANIEGRTYTMHRLAWFYMTGEWPSVDIDHKNLNRADNSWSNLREATKSQNNANRPASRYNKSGFKGVWFCRSRGNWQVSITKEKRKYFLGSYRCAEDAHAAYQEASIKLFGEFARAA